MSRLPIYFFSEDISFTLKDKTLIRNWIKNTITSEGKKLKELNIIFCSDNYLLEINKQYLNHNTFTDIVTFDNSESSGSISGDVFISIERIRENASKFKVPERDELHRVLIHGTLHLLGYKDKTKVHKTLMTKKEDQYLELRGF
ncbi:rRNA maturation RNase YbeY [Pedobacter sp. P351]|uniref:rRNA maturation RNase YbeY n=1 Tax=Pedobacter superstes TaxID=3133441 RepID=UPI0030B663CA